MNEDATNDALKGTWTVTLEGFTPDTGALLFWVIYVDGADEEAAIDRALEVLGDNQGFTPRTAWATQGKPRKHLIEPKQRAMHKRSGLVT